MTSEFWRQCRYWLPVAAYAALILYLSSLSHPEETFPLLRIEFADKAGHALEYGGFAIVLYRAFRHASTPQGNRYALLLAIASAATYGVLDEAYQHFLSHRTAEGWDVVADTIGAAIAAYGYDRITGAVGVPRRVMSNE